MTSSGPSGTIAGRSSLGGVVVSLTASTCSNARLRLLLDTTRKNLSAPIWLR